MLVIHAHTGTSGEYLSGQCDTTFGSGHWIIHTTRFKSALWWLAWISLQLKPARSVQRARIYQFSIDESDPMSARDFENIIRTILSSSYFSHFRGNDRLSFRNSFPAVRNELSSQLHARYFQLPAEP